MQDYLLFKADIHQPDLVMALDDVSIWTALAGEVLLRHLPLGKNWQVLDVGCGTGFPLLELAQRLGPESKVFGIDPHEEGVERAQFKAAVCRIGNVEIQAGSAEKMPFPDGYFDLIVSNLGINNFLDPQAVLNECHRVAKPASRLAISSNLQGTMTEFYGVFSETLRELGLANELLLLEKHVNQRISLPSMNTLFSKTGFRQIKVKREQNFWRFASGTALLNHFFIKLGFLGDWKKIVPEPEQERVFFKIEEKLNSRANISGELNLTIPLAYFEAQKEK